MINIHSIARDVSNKILWMQALDFLIVWDMLFTFFNLLLVIAIIKI
jgi:hypothetical protein